MYHLSFANLALILSGPSASPSSTLHTGSNLILSCTFEGVPAPVVTWTANGTDLDVDSNERLYVLTNDGSTQLIFIPIVGGDNGLYACAVNNNIGSPSVSTAIDVIVQGKTLSTVCSSDDHFVHVCVCVCVCVRTRVCVRVCVCVCVVAGW